MNSSFFIKLADSSNFISVARIMRRSRMKLFESLFDLKKERSILDIGGTEKFWKHAGYSESRNISITLLNTYPQKTESKNIVSATGDARNLQQFADRSFDIVFSNSTIEHVGNFNDQRLMATEILRVGKSYFVQTPNFWFPFEPHFMFLGFHYLPLSWRAFMLRHFSLGWFDRCRGRQESYGAADSIHLLTRKGISRLFPDGKIQFEYLAGFAKSIIVYKQLTDF